MATMRKDLECQDLNYMLIVGMRFNTLSDFEMWKKLDMNTSQLCTSIYSNQYFGECSQGSFIKNALDPFTKNCEDSTLSNHSSI